MDPDLIANILYATIRTGTPLLLVALGELVCEKSGVLNLGQEGMMLMGAVAGFIAAYHLGDSGIGIVSALVLAMAAGALMSLLFAFITLSLNANQVASGLALTIFGLGLSSFVGLGYVGIALNGIQPWELPLLSDLPLLGKVLFSHDPLVYFSLAMAALLAWFFRSTRAGLIVKAVGESPESAQALGLPVLRVRYLAVLFGGAMTGLAGAYLSLVYTPLWADHMSAGRGWIALALVVFASWRVGRAVLGAYLFGLMSIMHLVLQGFEIAISPNLLATLPYLVTIAVLVLLSSNQARSKLFAPLSLGKPFQPGH
ncbi:ABC transporter permease [Microbulbifer bruguierae]|uniref:ABC transporter permease n=1 Tax=Microbulbifer bruguierae TaxID=3029061 RepID=A0ABY8N8F3_9GAMM|nr:ABC transporter permease [Microbulbifer bruguierae]WGL15179.1 ABC transporter permease [Microbulbifer bruguierae]